MGQAGDGAGVAEQELPAGLTSLEAPVVVAQLSRMGRSWSGASGGWTGGKGSPGLGQVRAQCRLSLLGGLLHTGQG